MDLDLEALVKKHFSTKTQDKLLNVEPALVLDTNVLFDFFTFRDYVDAVNNEPNQIQSRIERIQAVFLLIDYLNNNQLASVSLAVEPIKVLKKRVPPSDSGNLTLWTKSLVKEYDVVWPNWIFGINNNPEFVDSDLTFKNRQNDNLLLKLTDRYKRPLISNDEKLRSRVKEYPTYSSVDYISKKTNKWERVKLLQGLKRKLFKILKKYPNPLAYNIIQKSFSRAAF
jgi:hypothetical protein